jgi:hypothetical protein
MDKKFIFIQFFYLSSLFFLIWFISLGITLCSVLKQEIQIICLHCMLSQFEKYTEKDYTIKLWTQYGYKTLNQKHCTSFVM